MSDEFETLTVESQGPEATVTAEVSQNSAGAWRGSVKVSITAPITFDGWVDHNHVVAEAEKRVEEIEADKTWETVDIRIREYNDAADALGHEPSVLITVPTQEETEIRNAVERLLTSGAMQVRELADHFNANSEVTATVKKGK